MFNMNIDIERANTYLTFYQRGWYARRTKYRNERYIKKKLNPEIQKTELKIAQNVEKLESILSPDAFSTWEIIFYQGRDTRKAVRTTEHQY